MPKIESVIFDLDGTLIDSAESIIFGLKIAIEKSRMRQMAPLNINLIGPPLKEVFKKLVHIETDYSLEKLIFDFKKYYDTIGYKQAKPYLGIENLLSKLKNLNIKIYLATNKRIKPTLKIVEHLDWKNKFNEIYAIDKFTNNIFSNKSMMIKNLIEKESIESKNTIYVGDTEEDIEFALENNLRAIFVRWGYGELKINLIRDEVKIISSTNEIIQIIKKGEW